MRFNAAIKAVDLQFDTFPKDLSNVVVRFSKGLRLANFLALCCDSVVAMVAQLKHYSSIVVSSSSFTNELPAILDDLHAQYGVGGHFMLPFGALVLHQRHT